MGNGDITPLILKLGTRWKQVVSISPQKLYTGDKTLLCNGRRLKSYVDVLENGITSYTYRGSNPGPTTPQHNVYTAYAITDPKILTTDTQLRIA